MDAHALSSAAQTDSLSIPALHQGITAIDCLATAGFQEVASVLSLIKRQAEAANIEHRETVTITPALNSVLEMTERYRNQIQWIAAPFHTEEVDHPQSSPDRALQAAIIDIDLMATDGFSEINAVAQLAISNIESSNQDWNQLGIVIGALMNTARRYQECVSNHAASSIEQPAPSNKPVPVRGTGIHSSDVLGEAYSMLAFVSEVLTTGVDCEFPKVSSTEGLCYIFDDIMHRMEIVDHQMMAIEQGRVIA